MRRKTSTLLALALTLLLAMLAPTLKSSPQEKSTLKVTRIWTVECNPAISAWLRKRAAAYEKETGVRLYLRSATREEADAALAGQENAIPPDLIVSHGAGEALAYLGYALILRDETAAILTPAPTSALFYRPTATPGPSPTPAPTPDLSALSAILSPPGLSVSLPGVVKSQNVSADFTAKKAPAALLTAGQTGALSFGYQAFALPKGESMESIGGNALSPAGSAFFAFLQAAPSQQALKDHGLYSILPGLKLYGEDDPLRALIESSLR